MSTMRAVVLTGHGGLDKLEYREDAPKPRAAEGEVLIRVKACGLNNTDINTRTGWYSKAVQEGTTAEAAVDGFANVGSGDSTDGGWGGGITFPRIQGADVCGIVEAVGDDAPRELIGRRVMVDPWILDANDPSDLYAARFFGSELDGGYGEYAVAPARNVYAVESDYTDAELATFGCAYTTAANMLRRSALAAGECVVITGASGGVGSALIQLAKLRGARVIALSSAGKADALRDIGADCVIGRDGDGLEDAIAEIASCNGADVALDLVGGALFPRLIDGLRRDGRYVASGAIAGAMVELDLRTLYLHDLTLVGATVVPPEVFPQLLRQIESRQLRPLLARAFPLRKLADAQRMFIEKKHVGNIVVTIDDDL